MGGGRRGLDGGWEVEARLGGGVKTADSRRRSTLQSTFDELPCSVFSAGMVENRGSGRA